jgi:multimeric flavodoxin WrbA
MNPKKLLCISGSYRKGGITDQAVEVVCRRAAEAGWQCEVVRLIERRLEFCRNCRACTQEKGEGMGKCVIEDDLSDILKKVGEADALVLACPVNHYEATAIMKLFEERLLGACYWPWGEPAPRERSKKTRMPSLLITSTAMPGILARFLTRSMRSLELISRCLRGKPAGKIYVGLISQKPKPALSTGVQKRLCASVGKLLAA